MKGSKSLIVFLVSAHFTTLQCKWNFAEKTYAMKKFLKTPVPIWTFNTTKGKVGKTRCDVDVLLTISKTHIIYHHLCYENLEKKNVRMLGTFDPRNKDRLFVQAKGSVYNVTDEMLYLNWRWKCAVFKVTTPCYGMCSWYEVRVWNLSTALNNAHVCIRKFKKLEPYGRGVYDEDCQNLVHRSAQLPILVSSNQKQERKRL
ncbi:uncharacterized protein LOC119167974 isoform X2 [Rhipicephalus microplus]|uniref:uncharacterized protein LOC119167974 isoform X2 n=1 Tax=Rhipicephalus microplus TaxID=6941 RepID=UPI003F6B917D